MTEQNGQATAILVAPVPIASSVRFWLIRVPSVSSIHMRAPPAPQQKDLSAVRSISTSFTPGSEREQLARRRVDLVVPAQVARVVVGHGLVDRRDRREPPSLHERARAAGVWWTTS